MRPALSFNLTNEYATSSSRAIYPWRVVEPFRVTTLAADGIGARSHLTWSVRLGDDELLRDAGDGRAVVQFEFRHVGREFVITLTERVPHADTVAAAAAAAQNLSTRVAFEAVMCKYVRREIRQLNEEDRASYFQALEVVARDAPSDLDAARSLYGASFVNLDYFVRKHVYAPGCTPYHSGLSFFTSHAAFTLEMDRALQQVRGRSWRCGGGDAPADVERGVGCASRLSSRSGGGENERTPRSFCEARRHGASLIYVSALVHCALPCSSMLTAAARWLRSD